MAEIAERHSTTDGRFWAYATLPKMLLNSTRILLEVRAFLLFWSLELPLSACAATIVASPAGVLAHDSQAQRGEKGCRRCRNEAQRHPEGGRRHVVAEPASVGHQTGEGRANGKPQLLHGGKR